MAAGFALLASSSMAQTYFVHETSDGFLNLRAGPGTSRKIIARLFPGDAVEYLEERGSWLPVRLHNGEVGWASEQFLGTYTNFDEQVYRVQQTSDGFLNLREGPGSSHAIKERLYSGDGVKIVKTQGNWLRVQVQKNSTLGWVHSRYIK